MKKTSSDLLLLDVNVLFAMAWPNHQFHQAAIGTMETHHGKWATCALTQLGFIRLSSTAAAIPAPKTPAEAAALLAEMVSDPLHTYLGTLPSPIAKNLCGRFDRVLGPRQVTDAYLLALAHSHDAVFLTFDTRLESLAQPGARVRVLS